MQKEFVGKVIVYKMSEVPLVTGQSAGQLK